MKKRKEEEASFVLLSGIRKVWSTLLTSRGFSISLNPFCKERRRLRRHYLGLAGLNSKKRKYDSVRLYLNRINFLGRPWFSFSHDQLVFVLLFFVCICKCISVLINISILFINNKFYKVI